MRFVNKPRAARWQTLRLVIPLVFILAALVVARAQGRSPLDLRVRVSSQTICPLDSWGVVVDLVNTSGHDLVVALPTQLRCEALSLAIVPEGTPPTWSDGGDGLLSGRPGRRVVLKPGGHAETPTLWQIPMGRLRSTGPGRLHVYARYEMTESSYPLDPEPTLVPATVSGPCPLQSRWCDDRIPGWLRTLEQAESAWRRGRENDASSLIDSVLREGTSCVRRTAMEVLCQLQIESARGDSAFNTCGDMWRSASDVGEREKAAMCLSVMMQYFGHYDEVASLVGDYDSPSFGAFREYCARQRRLSRGAPTGPRPWWTDKRPRREVPKPPETDSRLELRVDAPPQAVCPLDALNVTVEYTNRSADDLVITLPRHNCSGFTWLQMQPAGTPPPPPADMAPQMGEGDRKVRLKPGESVSSMSVWLTGIVPDGQVPAEWAVYASYYCPADKASAMADSPTPLFARSPAAPVCFEWCQPSARSWERKLRAARGQTNDEATLVATEDMIRCCLREGPFCARRAAHDTRCRLQLAYGKPAAMLTALREYWDFVNAPSDREPVFELLHDAVELKGLDPDAACAIVGDYESRRFGNFRKHCEQIKKDRAAEQGERK